VATLSPSKRLKDLLPTAAAIASGPSHLWDLTIDPRSQDGVEALYRVIVIEEDLARHLDPDGLVRVARALREDLLGLAADPTSTLCEPDVRILLLATTLGPAMAGVLSHRIEMAYEWLLWSVTDWWAIDGDVVMYPGWIHAAAASSLPELLDDVVVPWLTALYIYESQVAGLSVLSNTLLPLSQALAAQFTTEERRDLACALLSWASTVPDLADTAGFRAIADRFRALADADATPAPVRKLALRALGSCSASVTGDDPRRRSLELLNQFGHELHVTERLQALGTALARDGKQVLARIEEFLELIRAQQAEVESLAAPGGSAWVRGGMFSLISPPLLALLHQGEVASAVRLLGSWHGIDANAPLATNLLVGVLDRDDGLSWACEHVPLRATPTMVELPVFQAAANTFLGTTVTTRSGSATPLTIPERGRGVPDSESAADFQTVAAEFSSMPDAQSVYDAAAVSPPTGMLVLPTLQSPVQSLMLHVLGWTLPMSMSLQTPRPDAPVRRAVLWIGGTLLAARELDVVARILTEAGVQVVVRDEAEMTREQFLLDYHDPGFELFWVGLHGIRDALDPEAAHLLLPSERKILFSDLTFEHTLSAARRLLVLNACDSGTTATLGGLGEMGLAASAAGPGQAVVCHLWPIGSVTVAPVFAALLAQCLGTSSYFKAYAETVSILAAGPLRILQALPESAADLRHAVDDHPEDFQTITGWGSAAFFE
jgi:hypothetical protein